jgi:hypothetical protein
MKKDLREQMWDLYDQLTPEQRLNWTWQSFGGTEFENIVKNWDDGTVQEDIATFKKMLKNNKKFRR